MNLGNAFRNVRGRIQYGTLLLSVVPMLLVGLLIGGLAFYLARDSLHERALQQVVTVRVDKTDRILSYFNELRDQTLLLASLRATVDAVSDLSAGIGAVSAQVPAIQSRERMQRFYNGDYLQEYAKLNAGASIDVKPFLEQLDDTAYALQYQYLADNPNPLGEKSKLKQADDSAYGKAHAAYHERVVRFVTASGFPDVVLVDASNGRILYSYAKRIDFGTSLSNGPFAKTEMGELFRQIREGGKPESFVLSPTRQYQPNFDDASLFIGVPVFNENRLSAVLITQVPFSQVNRIMTFDSRWKDAGLGDTGETYLLSLDDTLLSNTRSLTESPGEHSEFLKHIGTPEAVIKVSQAKNSDIGLVRVVSRAGEAARRGETGAFNYNDYRGEPVVGAFAPLKVLERDWIIVAKIDQAEAFAPVNSLLRDMLFAGIGILALTLLVSTYFSNRLARSVNGPIDTLQSTIAKLSAGDLDARTRMPPNDELGELGSALDNLLDERVATLAAAARENEQLNQSVIEIMQAVSRLSSRDLTVKVPVTTDVTGAISDALNFMTGQTAQVLRNVNDISNQVAQASGRVRERSASAMLVAAEGSREIEQASQELSDAALALKDIAGQASQADRAAEEAILSTREALNSVRETVGGISASRDLIRETEKRIKRLGERSQEITTTVNIIGNIAERTSMLALNTSMQAVAAGEAGRAYAVVADEVKRLAEGARGATQQISNLVSAIQSETIDTVEAINRAITQVVEISKMAERAGEQMRSTEEKTDLLVNSVRSIAETTSLQSRASDTLQARAQQIRLSTRQTADELAIQANETRNLDGYANGLLDSVRVFTLPAA
ncbi:methyl-accepting chemotaxis protein [Tahibacter aquaticus]|uniref:Methyl-accepting chemotaxis protein n=1 Tax=Tahibacter aquaticus TaxID=520092 RepID=A0A4R6YML4_9GAMM|nr:methyl-accepting chemotaxis protein [Tahibacter aquaticus]TDR38704.1 methyl-accepting chemotaxis protein [Tahibacter aquaticus]